MSVSVVPGRSVEQRLVALERANEIRYARAALKRALRDGDIRGWEVVADTHPDYLTMRVYDLLVALPKFGQVKARKLLVQLRISHVKTLGGLSDRQRCELVDALRRRS